ncbi:MAG: hypothetical protein SVY53_01585 [Chloroflexota bacterium]|nr:hypothetical protein [Chloroflexota bacterium]
MFDLICLGHPSFALVLSFGGLDLFGISSFGFGVIVLVSGSPRDLILASGWWGKKKK